MRRLYLAALAVAAFNSPNLPAQTSAVYGVLAGTGLVVLPLTLTAIIAGRRPARWWYTVGGALFAALMVGVYFVSKNSQSPLRHDMVFPILLALVLIVTIAGSVASALAVQRNPMAGRAVIAGGVLIGGIVGAAAGLAAAAAVFVVLLAQAGL